MRGSLYMRCNARVGNVCAEANVPHAREGVPTCKESRRDVGTGEFTLRKTRAAGNLFPAIKHS
jgi:hypothetical protein